MQPTHPDLDIVCCIPANTNDPTHDIKPDKKELNGNVPTRQQYTNCTMPLSIMYSKYASIIFIFFGVD